MSRLKVDQGQALTTTNAQLLGNLATVPAIPGPATTTQAAPSFQNAQVYGMECYDDVYKEITKKLYGDDANTVALDILDPSIISTLTAAQPLVYDAGDLFRQDLGSTAALTQNAGGLAIVTAAPANGLQSGTILVQRRVQDDKGRIWTIEGLPHTTDQIAFATLATTDQVTLQAPMQATLPPPPPIQPASPPPPQQPSISAAVVLEERWFESDEQLQWTQSRIARYNPTQKVFRCVDCDFVGFLSRVAEHWLGNHADLRVFHCPRCPYTSAWARCVRMHLTRQHGETLTDNSLWKENPVLEEVTKYLNTLKTKVEQKSEPVNSTGEKRYTCPCCPYQTDRRDLYNRHENIHRDEKPFQCYVCDKQFNRADHVKKHFIRMHRDHTYDINKIRKASPSKQSGIQLFNGGKLATKQVRETVVLETGSVKHESSDTVTMAMATTASTQVLGVSSSETQQMSQIAYFTTPATASPTTAATLQGIPGGGIGVTNNKKDIKIKGNRKKKCNEKMYTCSYCPWQGVDNWCLKRHLNTHIKPFLCALCDYKAARSERLATHVLKVHNKRVCHKCSFLADDSESLSQHIQESHQNPLVKTGFNCNICQEYFELRADLEAHAILEHQKVIVQCDLCDFRTTDELSMEAHLRDKHNLTPGMGAVAAAAAAAAAAAIGQPVNTQYMQNAQPQIAEQVTSEHPGVITTNPLSVASSSVPSPAPFVQQQSLTGGTLPQKILPAPEESPEPETLCEKCGIDFIDEPSRKLHEKRHTLVNPSEDDAVKGPTSLASKRFVRTYVCSTCSYTCATKKMMMQHQRAHTGFELVCQADRCMFSTPFENTLKEHIQNDHGSEEHVRCPHCGLKMPSSTAFTSHWRLHHVTICSLCVNIYRSRYDVKENDIQDVSCKFTSPPLFTLDTGSHHSLLASLSSSDFPSLSDHRLVDDFASLDLPVLDEPLLKRSKVDSGCSQNCSTAILYKRESIKFLPRLVEVKVCPMPPKISRKSRRFRRRRRNSKKLAIPKLDSSTNTSPGGDKKMTRLLKSIQTWETYKRSSLTVPARRRYCQRGTYSWLYRNSRDGWKCHSPLCEHKCSWRYPRKVGLVLHRVWAHRLPRFNCDICGLSFVHLYQAYLHKLTKHDQLLTQQQQNQPGLHLRHF